MEFWTLLAMASSLWIFVSLGVWVSLDQVINPTPWHLRFLRTAYDDGLSPSTHCRYFWYILAAPLVCFVLYGIAAVFCFIILFCRTCFDWVIMPLSGRYVVGALTKEYWKSFVTFRLVNVRSDVTLERGRKDVYADLPLRRHGIAALALIALFIWGFVGYGAIARTVSEVAPTLIDVIWFIVSMLGAVYLCRYYMRDDGGPKRGLRHKYADGVAMFLGKFCKTLVYPSTPKTD